MPLSTPRTVQRAAVRVILAGLATGLVIIGSAGAGQAAVTYSKPLKTAISELPVGAEDRTGYVRTAFKHWIDADGDGCDTREEVLIAEAVVKPTVGAGCTLTGGKWYSYYDARTWTDKSDLDVDHLVPLAEAWDSGASGWTAAQRQEYANDLGDDRDLVAVTDSVNQSKSDQDPAEWMPTQEKCRYVGEWVAVKVRWRLTVDSSEKAALTSLSSSCSNTTITTTRAR